MQTYASLRGHGFSSIIMFHQNFVHSAKHTVLFWGIKTPWWVVITTRAPAAAGRGLLLTGANNSSEDQPAHQGSDREQSP